MDTDRQRTIGLLGAISMGIGGMVGGGIFAVLGEAVALSHGATPVAFLVGGTLALLTGLAYARLTVAYPSRGGTVAFIDAAFGSNLLSGSLNLMLWLSYLVTIALYATAFAAYAQTFFGSFSGTLLTHALITLAIALPTLANLISAAAVSRAETVVVVIKIALLVGVIAACAPYVAVEPLAPQHWGSTLSIVTAGMIIFVAYEGFELIANSAEDIQRPSRNLPIAFIAAVTVVVALYVLIAVITVGTVPDSQVLAVKDYVLAVAAEPALGHAGFVVVAWAAVLATLSAINATIYGNARLGYVLAKDGVLPARFDAQRHDLPLTGVLVTAALSMLLANSIDLTDIAIIGSASFLLVFALVNAAAFRLADQIRGSRLLHGAGLVFCAVALLILLAHTYRSNPTAVAVFFGFLLLSVLFELVYGIRTRGHFLLRRYGRAARGSAHEPVHRA
ncbi:APC family permease [Salinisphaera sp. SPP-AMP-43]|uniref:APC family permease n=1 Tax=Salinisphaera sp. SPP-AMP-43 TaxID=3121288 RepID=UPI003C6DD914